MLVATESTAEPSDEKCLEDEIPPNPCPILRTPYHVPWHAYDLLIRRRSCNKPRDEHRQFTLQWVPAFCGFPGNKRADELAKQGTV